MRREDVLCGAVLGAIALAGYWLLMVALTKFPTHIHH